MIAMELRKGELRLRLSGAERLLAWRRDLVLPRERIQRAFVLKRRFAMRACPRFPIFGWSTRRSRVGTFGFGDDCQLWSVRDRPVVLALYLKGEPFHRIVVEVSDPARTAVEINTWAQAGSRR
ncbi:MAG TPA: hypothetical protein VD813_08090 [Pseudonocardia sp.]|nr:hypothetical protein [Pseudonocardia sp.]